MKQAQRNIQVILFYNRPNRYSFNALAGALEASLLVRHLSVEFPRSREELLKAVVRASRSGTLTVVGLSFFTTQLWEMQSLFEELAPYRTEELLLVAGGPHPSGEPPGTTLRLGADVVIRGEGEAAFVELLTALLEGRSWQEVPGLFFRDEDGQMRSTGRRAWIDLDGYPPFSAHYHKFGPVEISRGCPFTCSYCQTPYLSGGRMRHRSVPAILEAVEQLKRAGLWNFRAVTPNAFAYGSPDGCSVHLPRLEALLEALSRALRPRGKIYFGTFPSEVRPEHVTEETVRLVKRYADNDNLILGAQTGSPRLLEQCRRRHTVEDVLAAVERIRSAGLGANVDFIFGLPGETDEDVELSIRLMRKLVVMGARIHAHSFLPLPQTPFGRFAPRPDVAEVGRKIARLFPGAVYGDWLKQARLAQQIFRTLNRSSRESPVPAGDAHSSELVRR